MTEQAHEHDHPVFESPKVGDAVLIACFCRNCLEEDNYLFTSNVAKVLDSSILISNGMDDGGLKEIALNGHPVDDKDLFLVLPHTDAAKQYLDEAADVSKVKMQAMDLIHKYASSPVAITALSDVLTAAEGIIDLSVIKHFDQLDAQADPDFEPLEFMTPAGVVAVAPTVGEFQRAMMIMTRTENNDLCRQLLNKEEILNPPPKTEAEVEELYWAMNIAQRAALIPEFKRHLSELVQKWRRQ